MIYDVAVIGGGPAGCSAAITLAGQGARVVLCEAKTYPHHKVCGEFLSPECQVLFDRLELYETLASQQPVPIMTVELSAPSGIAWEAPLPGTAWGLSRYTLDALMAERARAVGVTVCEGTPIGQIEGNLAEGFKLTSHAAKPLHARTVIAAHGKRSALDRALKRRFLDQPQPFIALKAHLHGPALPQRIELHTFPGGYCGMSEIEGGAANVCLLVRQDIFRRACDGGPADVNTFLAWMQRQNPRLAQWLAHAERMTDRWYSIGQIPFVDKPVLEGDILMTGDAAGLIAPLAGDGIAMALRGGQLAARHIASFLSGQCTADDMRREYAARWRREFGARLKLARWLQALMLRPVLLAPALRLINILPPLGLFLIHHTRDMRSTTMSKENAQ